MTCIATLVHQGSVWMGADAIISNVYLDRFESAQAKIFKRSGILIGITGYVRLLQILQYELQIPRYHPDDAPEKYIASDLVKAMRKSLKSEGYLKEEDNKQEYYGEILIGFKGRVFLIDDNFGMTERTDGFSAIGCGARLALGSLYDTRDSKYSPGVRIRRALEAAARFSIAVGPPFTILKLDPKGK